MFFFILMLICNLILVFVMAYACKRYGKYGKHRVLDVTLTEEQIEDAKIQEIVKIYNKRSQRVILLGFILSFLPFYFEHINYPSIFIILYFIWCFGFIAVVMSVQIKAHRQLYKYKLEKGYVAGISKNLVMVDTRVSAGGDKMPFSANWFLLPFLLGFMIINFPEGRKLLDSMAGVVIFVLPFFTKILFFSIYYFLIKRKNKIYSLEEEVNFQCCQVTKRELSAGIIIAAWLDSIAMFLVQIMFLDEFRWREGMIYLITGVELIGLFFIIRADFLSHRLREKILNNAGGDGAKIIVDDDYFWAKGWYFNENNSNLFVQDRINDMNFTLNFGHPAARILTVLFFVFVVGTCVFTGYMMLRIDFEIPSMKVEKEEIIIDAPFYGKKINISEITDVRLIDEMPEDKWARTNGAATEKYHLGKFKGKRTGECYLYIRNGYFPILQIDTKDMRYFYNSVEEGDVEQLYQKIYDFFSDGD